MRLLVWLAIGFAIYFFYGARRAQAVRDERAAGVRAGAEDAVGVG